MFFIGFTGILISFVILFVAVSIVFSVLSFKKGNAVLGGFLIVIPAAIVLIIFYGFLFFVTKM